MRKKSSYNTLNGQQGSQVSFFNVLLSVGVLIGIGIGSAGLGVSLWHHNLSNHLDLQIPAQSTNTTEDDNDEGILVYDPVTDEYTLLTGDVTGQKLEWSNLHNSWILSPVVREYIGHIFINEGFIEDLNAARKTIQYNSPEEEEHHIVVESPYWDITYNFTTGEIVLNGVRFDNSSVDYIEPVADSSDWSLGEFAFQEDRGISYKFWITFAALINGNEAPFMPALQFETCEGFLPLPTMSIDTVGWIPVADKRFTFQKSFFLYTPARYISPQHPLCFKLGFRDDLNTLVPQLDVDFESIMLNFEFVTR